MIFKLSTISAHWLRARLPGALLILMALVTTGCASTSMPVQQQAATAIQSARGWAAKADPLEAVNRDIFAFNEALDDAVLSPVARTYRRVVPDVLQLGVSNVFDNVSDAWSATNHLLQGKGRSTLTMTARVVANTVLGVGGLVDVATPLGFERETEDFGLTLGHWGIPAGPYLVLPVLGPSSLRDLVALPVDRQVTLPAIAPSVPTRNTLLGLELIQRRADLLGASSVVSQIALDKYVFLREAYLSRRRSLIGDEDADPVKE